MSLQASSSQTVGPYFRMGLAPLYQNQIAGPEFKGEHIRLSGRVLDGDGLPVPDALVEIWQANAAGRYNHPEDVGEQPLDPTFYGFGRWPTDSGGSFEFSTIKPGQVRGLGGKLQAPHLLVSIFMRGILKRVVSRIYFEGEDANDQDPILQLVPAERRSTLIARKEAIGHYSWTVHMQGSHETVFFDV